jgi:hypothetical protein
MGDLFLFALNLNMGHHSYRPLKGAWNIDFDGADQRGIFKAKLSHRSGRKRSGQIGARCKEDRDDVLRRYPIAAQDLGDKFLGTV